MVALLRGVNVGGSTRLAMADLRAAAEAAGFVDVATYVQSGNLVLRSPDEPDPDRVADILRDAIASRTSVAPDVLVRTREELIAVTGRNPFLDRSDDPTHHHVIFLASRASLAGIAPAAYAPEDAAADGRELFLFLPNGIGRSKLAAALTRRSSGAGTARNWRTVTRLVELSGRLP